MGSVSNIKHIAQAAVTDMFADLACDSAGFANEVLAKYPDYRAAKGDNNHPFWMSGGLSMLAEIKKYQLLIDQHERTPDEILFRVA